MTDKKNILHVIYIFRPLRGAVQTQDIQEYTWRALQGISLYLQ